MQRTVIIYGLIAGFIIMVLGSVQWSMMVGDDGKINMTSGTILGYASMIISLSMVFFGIRQFRDRHLGGKITFGRAFSVGILISLVASALYVIGWMVFFHTSEVAQTFPAQYIDHMREQMVADSMTIEEINIKIAGLEKNFEMYTQNKLIMAGMTLMEMLPVGIIITLISALILKRK